ncbi:MAG: hypothetical protein JWM68_3377 [Verrucomicrobiales bacterium]|nr:hypothetical protein [Verrucomicrobiales bacterium]
MSQFRRFAENEKVSCGLPTDLIPNGSIDPANLGKRTP